MRNLTSWLKTAFRKMDEAAAVRSLCCHNSRAGAHHEAGSASLLLAHLGLAHRSCTGPLEQVGNQLGHPRDFWFSAGRANHSARPSLPALGDSPLPVVWRELCRVEHRAAFVRYRYIACCLFFSPGNFGATGRLCWLACSTVFIYRSSTIAPT